MGRIAILICLIVIAPASAQLRKSRLGVLPNLDLYSQKTPKDTLDSVLNALQRDRIDYVVAHLIDPTFIDARIEAMLAYHEKIAGEELASASKQLSGKELADRLRERATTLGFERIKRDLSAKLVDEPDNLRDLKRFFREGELIETGDTATITLKDVKEKAVYFRKINDHWYMENRRDQATPPPAKNPG